MKVFVTGTAGFIGFHLAQRLLSDGHTVVGFDGLTAYYDVDLKRARHEILRPHEQFTAVEAMLEDRHELERAVSDFRPDVIVHLAAQAGVRYSLEEPVTYVDSNLVGTFNLLEVARAHAPSHLMIASTSSVYGGNEEMPFGETDRTDLPMSLYAATKKACEGMSHAYSHLFKIPTTCFRFFTVYGPWGRPDMALFKFVDQIERGLPIEVYGEGRMMRDFTYVDDLVEGIVRLTRCVPEEGNPVSAGGVEDSLSAVAPWRVVNIAGGQPVGLMPFVESIEGQLGQAAEKVMLPMQQGDVADTHADASLLRALTDFEPNTDLETGVKAFVEWFREYRDADQSR